MASYLYGLGRRLALALWVFWHEALMYFGLLPYPHEAAQRSRIRPPDGPGVRASPDTASPSPRADSPLQARFQDP